MEGVVYLDNAASSWPKPPEVAEAMKECIELYAANPGRGGHRMAMEASRYLLTARKRIARLFHIPNANDVLFYMNTTMALNQAIKGFLKTGDHVICTSIEHNSVRRPLEYLKREGLIDVSYAHNEPDGSLNPVEIEQLIQPNTRLIVAAHASNLLGTILPVEEIGVIAKDRGIVFLVDAAQTAGVYPIDVTQMNIDMMAFPGHKGLLGPQGTGGLYVRSDLDLVPFIHGGTGSQSEAKDQPSTRPDRYESGTPNTVGIAGLSAAIEYILQVGVDRIREKEIILTGRMVDGLSSIPAVAIYGPIERERRVGVVAFNIKGLDPNETASILDQHYGIAVRAGFHCTPLGHLTAGTDQYGAVRASISYHSSEKDIDIFLEAIKEIAQAMGSLETEESS